MLLLFHGIVHSHLSLQNYEGIVAINDIILSNIDTMFQVMLKMKLCKILLFRR